ncbi:DUF4177 domain-containing protein [Planktotalea sp.]|uniref:DUF4177 domain-containing protein n=1 Tax=Planktotalea sp. TaxID=2029877 RepID=UPI0035C7C4FD
MIRYEYKVIPAPTRGRKGKGIKGADDRFAYALEQLINDMAASGWEYQRADTLPSEERSGLTSKTTVFRNVLVFRRAVETEVEAFEPKLLDPPSPSEGADDISETEAEQLEVADTADNEDTHSENERP